LAGEARRLMTADDLLAWGFGEIEIDLGLLFGPAV
jgi:hypothetical protein